MVVSALREDRLAAAPKKAGKLCFADPFIFHSVRDHLAQYTGAPADPRHALADERTPGGRVEGSFLSHLRRAAPTGHIKAEGEGDAAHVEGGRFWPIEVKWTVRLRPHELKRVRRYPNALIAAQVRRSGEVSGVPVLPAPADRLARDLETT